jgi:hypothetical protein
MKKLVFLMRVAHFPRRSKKPVRMYILKNDYMQIGEAIYINQKHGKPFLKAHIFAAENRKMVP